MEVTTSLTYTQLKAKVAETLGRPSIPASTLSRWMAALGYPRGNPGRRRRWDCEDAFFIAAYGLCLSWGYTPDQSAEYAKRQIEKQRSQSHAY